MAFRSKVGLTKKLESPETNITFLVYTMGKVGSRTVAKSLNKLYENDNHIEVLHLQDIGGYYRKKYNSNYFFYANKNIDKIRFYFSMIIREKYREKLLKTIKAKEKVYIITLVRDPIARAISANFQALESVGRLSCILKNTKKLTYERMSNSFYKDVDHNSIQMWFDLELKRNFKIDIYNYPFDFKNKYIHIKEKNINLLLIRAEDLKDSENVIKNFIGNNSFKIINDNIGNEKWYSKAYIEFKKKFIPSKSIVEKYLASKYTKHFYTNNEINRMRDKYLSKCDW